MRDRRLRDRSRLDFCISPAWCGQTAHSRDGSEFFCTVAVRWNRIRPIRGMILFALELLSFLEYDRNIYKLNEIQRPLACSECRTYGLLIFTLSLPLDCPWRQDSSCRGIECSLLACALFSKVVHQKRFGNLAIENASVARQKN